MRQAMLFSTTVTSISLDPSRAGLSAVSGKTLPNMALAAVITMLECVGSAAAQ